MESPELRNPDWELGQFYPYFPGDVTLAGSASVSCSKATERAAAERQGSCDCSGGQVLLAGVNEIEGMDLGPSVDAKNPRRLTFCIRKLNVCI